jgi:arylsulfatase A-like enzyme
VRGETARAGYDASLASVDDAIGRFREQLAALGVRHNTLFIITADHGEAFGEHGHNGHGQSVYEEEIRVPLLFHWPERIAAMRVDESVHHVDLVPTVLAMAGIPAESQFDGRSLWALSGAPRQPSPVVVTRFVYPEDVDGPVRDQTESHAIIDYPWKLITFGSGGGSVRAELYRLDLDPGERRDLARSEGARVKTLQEALRRFIADQAERRRRFDLDHARAGMPPSTPPTRDLLDQLRSLGYVR